MATSPGLDDLTTHTIRRALAEASAGRTAEACAIGESGLAQGGDVAALNAMLGMLRVRRGEPEQAALHLKAAHHARPGDPVIALNLAQALVQLESYGEVLAILRDSLVEADSTGRLLRLRAFSAQAASEFVQSVADYERAVESAPDDWESWNNLGNARRSAGDFEGAVAALRKASELAPDSAPIRFNLASSLAAAGNLPEAEEAFQRMAEDFPEDPAPMRELHVLYKESGRDQEAEQAIVAATQRAPHDIDLLLGHASYLTHLQRLGDSEAAYRRVLEVDPVNGLAHLGIASCFDLTNRTADLAALVQQAEQRRVATDALSFMKAMDHRRAKRFAEGLAAMDAVPADLETARRAHVLGQLLEGVGRYDEAFAAFEQMNAMMREQNPGAEDRGRAYREMISERSTAMTGEFMKRWRPSSLADSRPSPIFLYGFPRSGTTLLDTMLMGHPKLEILEEERTLHVAFEKFGSFDAMAAASDQQIAEARDAFFSFAAERAPLAPGTILVDKNPLAINAVPIIKRLFPEARHILALRHPCDVVLSCFVTNFRMNDGMASFSRLDTAAELYDLSFGYFERVREHMPIDVHAIRYEDVIKDRDRALRALFDFLGIDWHDSVLDHEATAKGRGRIKTASYAQVVEPIYTRSAGRWTNYRKHLEPVLPVLEPWIGKFGYEL